MSKQISLILLIIIFTFLKSHSLTNGPIQPEYSSFEPVDVTDLVNLSTGDFTYVLPLGDVKGPAGVGYPVVLNYHAGITNGQQATWVGLGWSLNVGAINRIVRGYPDDQNGELSAAYMYNAGKEGWDFNLSAGWGPIDIGVGWSEKGFEGPTSIGLQMNIKGISINLSTNLKSEVSSIGIGYHGSSKLGLNVGMTFGGGNEPSWYASASISLGSDGKGSAGNSVSGSGKVNGKVGRLIGLGMANISLTSKGHVGMSIAGASSFEFNTAASNEGLYQWQGWHGFSITIPCWKLRLGYDYSYWGWNFSQLDVSESYGYLFHSKNFSQVVHSNSKLLDYLYSEGGLNGWTYDQCLSGRSEGDPCTNIWEFAINFMQNYIPKLEYLNYGDFNFPAQDIYTMTGQGNSGLFKPYTYNSLKTCYSENPIYDGVIGEGATPNNPKNFDNYFNEYEETISQHLKDGIVFKLVNEPSYNLIDNLGNEFSYNSNKYKNIDRDENSKPINVAGTKITPIFGLDDENLGKINGFIVTDQEGKSYYYTMALNTFNQFSYITDENRIPDKNTKEVSFKADYGGYASTWLLTAITGPDYIKRKIDRDWEPKELIMPHEGDWGYWVRFRYKYGNKIKKDPKNNLVIDSSTDIGIKSHYVWSDPYESEPKRKSKCTFADEKYKYSSMFGFKEITYLKSIETATEVAYFRTTERLDGIGSRIELTPLPYQLTFDKKSNIKIENFVDNNEIDINGCWLEKIAVPIVKDNVGTGENVYKNCTKLVIHNNGYNINQLLDEFDVAEEGKEMFILNFMTDHFYYLFNGEENRIKKDQFGEMRVVKDSYGFNSNTKSINENINLTEAFEIIGFRKPKSNVYDFGADPRFHGDSEVSKATACGTKHSDIWGITNYVKCFHAEIDHKKGTLNYYLMAYNVPNIECKSNNGDIYRKTKIKSRIPFFKRYDYAGMAPSDPFRLHKITNVKLSSGNISTTAGSISKTKKASPYLKKLDEIAWFSKAEYPYINTTLDPLEDDSYTDTNLVKPKSYRRVKFQYNYELAINSTNSIASKGGRLTLKTLQIEAGEKKNSVSMPPYIFDYQGKKVKYRSYEHADFWGYTINDAKIKWKKVYTDNQTGVNWNLSKILFPSGGALEIEYERDHIYSSATAMHRVTTNYPCESSDEKEFKQEITNRSGSYVVGNNLKKYNDTTLSFTYTGQEEDIEIGNYFILHRINEGTHINNYHADLLFKIDSVSINNNEYTITFTPSTKVIFTGTNDINSIFVLKKADLYCDNIRTRQLTSHSLATTAQTIYEYPINGGVLEVLPYKAYPHYFSKQLNGYFAYRYIHLTPYCPNIEMNYNTGNTSVIYPEVTVYNYNNDENPKGFGSTKYSFYTMEDEINVNGEMTSIIEDKEIDGTYKDAAIKVRQIVDRSAIVGQLKKVEFLNSQGTTVKTVEDIYTFSEDVRSKAGVVYNKLDNPLTDEEPLGLIQERSVRITHDEKDTINPYKTSSVVDLVISKPINIGSKITNDNVTARIDYGMFDARTGTPMVTVSTNYNEEGQDQKKLAMDVPYLYTLKENNNNDYDHLMKRNIHHLSSGSFAADVSHFDWGNTIKNLGDIKYSDIINPITNIKNASAQTYQYEPFNNDVPFEQYRFWLKKQYTLTDHTSFTWPTPDNVESNWLKVSEVLKLDKFSRMKTGLSADNVPTTSVFHPRLNVVTGAIVNGSYEESGVFTCDYYENDKSHASYFDYDNGWELGGSSITDKEHHFGHKSVRVENNWGPTCNFKVTNKVDYILSAWVKVIEGEVKLSAEYRKSSDGKEIMNWPIRINQLSSVYYRDSEKRSASEASQWTYVEVKVKTKTKLADDIGYIRVYVGTHDSGIAYIDDIRFYPKDAQINSFYYDQELGTPITFVDNNNKVRRYEYDKFGRLIKTYNNSNDLLGEAEYHQVRENSYYNPIIIEPGIGKVKGSTVDFKWVGPVPEPDGDFSYTIAGVNQKSLEYFSYDSIYDMSKTINIKIGKYLIGVFIKCDACNDTSGGSKYSSSLYSLLVYPEDFFEIRDIKGDLIAKLGGGVRDAMIAHFKNEDYTKMASDLENTYKSDGTFKYSDKFYVSEVNRTIKYKVACRGDEWDKEKWIGDGGTAGQTGTGNNEMRRIEIHLLPGYIRAPSVTFDFHFMHKSDHYYVTKNWGEHIDMKKPDNADVYNYRIHTSSHGYHFWYDGYKRKNKYKWQGWQTNGGKAGGTQDEISALRIYLFVYDYYK